MPLFSMVVPYTIVNADGETVEYKTEWMNIHEKHRNKNNRQPRRISPLYHAQGMGNQKARLTKHFRFMPCHGMGRSNRPNRNRYYKRLE